jgi:hypothetical protein
MQFKKETMREWLRETCYRTAANANNEDAYANAASNQCTTPTQSSSEDSRGLFFLVQLWAILKHALSEGFTLRFDIFASLEASFIITPVRSIVRSEACDVIVFANGAWNRARLLDCVIRHCWTLHFFIPDLWFAHAVFDGEIE